MTDFAVSAEPSRLVQTADSVQRIADAFACMHRCDGFGAYRVHFRVAKCWTRSARVMGPISRCVFIPVLIGALSFGCTRLALVMAGGWRACLRRLWQGVDAA